MTTFCFPLPVLTSQKFGIFLEEKQLNLLSKVTTILSLLEYGYELDVVYTL